MAYDRYDTRRGSSEQPRYSDDRYRDRNRDRDREERGFFERAGEQIASWFGDEEDERRSRGERDFGRSERDYSRSDRDYGRSYGPDQERGRSGSDRDEDRSYRPTEWSSSQSDYRSSGEREPWGGGDRDRERSGYRPVTGDYGRSEGLSGRNDRSESQWGRDEYRRTSFAGSSDRSQHDPHYHQWRQRQIEELDRDYDEYRREHQSKFENDFGSWREKRQTKRQMLSQIREHMEVVGSDDEHVGTVDRVAGDRIILTKSDPEAGGAHHSLSCTDIDRVEDDRVILDFPSDQASNRWRDENRDRALFEREDQGEAGPHMLDRSFSGTYR